MRRGLGCHPYNAVGIGALTSWLRAEFAVDCMFQIANAVALLYLTMYTVT